MVPSINIPGTTPHCLVSTGGDVNILGTRNLVYSSGSNTIICSSSICSSNRSSNRRSSSSSSSSSK